MILSSQELFIYLILVIILFFFCRKPIRILWGLLDLLHLLIDTKLCGRFATSRKNINSKQVRREEWSILYEWKKRVRKTPHNPFLQLIDPSICKKDANQKCNSIIHPTSLTFQETDVLSNQIAHVIYELLIPQKEYIEIDRIHREEFNVSSPPVVAVLLSSSPFLVACYLGLVKAGACGGLINTNLVGKSLAHAIRVCLESKKSNNLNNFIFPNLILVEEGALFEKLSDKDVQSVLYEFEVRVIMKEMPDMTKSNISMYESAISIDKLILQKTLNISPTLLRSHHTPRWDSTFLYVFTSGTTGGLAKASILKHIRFRISGSLFHIIGHLTPEDKVYCALPLYHSAACMIGIGGCILSGACMAIRPKFSASTMARDLVEYKCTVVQYIGEFARYALSAKESKEEEILRQTRRSDNVIQRSLSYCLCWKKKKWNGVRLAFGNGMRPEVWESFQNRFGIGQIVEFYASTEGNANMVNNCSIVGCIGVIPEFILYFYPIALVKCNPVTGEILRDPKTNLAILCDSNEPGQLLGLISKTGSSTQTDPTRMYEGYTDGKASNKKIANNIKQTQDQWFATGDLLRKDWFGNYFWVDRIGDTFRWKGENVSTCEVAAAFVENDFIMDVNVYGVEVPGHPGRAGMARITLKNGKCVADVNFGELYVKLTGQLATYARPLFLRFAKESNDSMTTSTFKQMKGSLRDQGFHPFYCDGEDIYFRNDEKKTYQFLTQKLCDAICSSKIRV